MRNLFSLMMRDVLTNEHTDGVMADEEKLSRRKVSTDAVYKMLTSFAVDPH